VGVSCPPAGASVRLVHSFLKAFAFLGCLVLMCPISAPVYAQVDQKCVQQCESGNCIAGDTSSQRLQQCRAACVKNCTKVPSQNAQGVSPTVLPAPAQESGYMKITTARGTIPGESKDIAHQGWIDLRTFQPGATQLAGSAGNASGSKGTLVVTKAKDSSSVVLQKACASGEHLKEVVIDVYRAGKPAQRLTLSDVLITSFQASQVDRTTESMSLNFTKIEY
jgi:type VI secretion system secreted protein Hcp